MTRTPLEDSLGPLIDVARLIRQAVRLRLALVRADMSERMSSIVTALVLGILALVLLVTVLGLLVQAGLLVLASLGLTAVQALLVTALICVVLALILISVARSCLRRATRPLTSPPATGTDLAARRP